MSSSSLELSDTWRREPVAVLVSGGPDSAVLVGELGETSPEVVPMYVRFGNYWESAEEDVLRRFLKTLKAPTVKPLVAFDMPMSAVYGDHWSITGEHVPDASSPDSAVYLPGRNLLLLAQASIWCHLHEISVIALGLLQGNPFPDSSAEFFLSWQNTIGVALNDQLQIVCPYQNLTKVDILNRGRSMRLDLTWSCIRPVKGSHCGECNKCSERRKAFRRAGIEDMTRYH